MCKSLFSLDFNTFVMELSQLEKPLFINLFMSLKKIAFIINPISGKGKQKNIPQLINRFLDAKKFDYQIFNSEYAGHMSTLTIEIITKGFEIIIVVGGDGSINEVFPNLIHSKIIFGIIPRGSGNGLARFLNIPMNPKKAIQLINQLSVQKIDTAEINGHPFINIAGVGFDAHIAELFNKNKKRGFWSYFKIILNTYFSYKEKTFILELNNEGGKKIKALMICFANSNQFGNNMIISPRAKMNDGLIDVCVMNKIPFWLVPFNIFLAFTGLIEKSNHYKRFKAKNLRLSSSDKQVVNIDGEPIQMDADIELNVIPSSIKIISTKFKK